MIRPIICGCVLGMAVLAANPALAASAHMQAGQLMQAHANYKRSYAKLIQPIVKAHPWVASFGSAEPVRSVKMRGHTYYVIFGCDPNDCVAEQLAVLIDKSSAAAMGGFSVNKTQSGKLADSKIQWLNGPHGKQLEFLAAYLFR